MELIRRKVSRRDFLKLSAGSTAALGLLLLRFPNFEKVLAAATEEYPVIWIQGSACTGCSVTILNSLSPKIQDVLVSQVIPGKHLSLRYHPTVMAAAGDLATKAMEDTAKNKGGYVLVVEGAAPIKDNGIYCEVGEIGGHGMPFVERLASLGQDAMAVIAIGNCAVSGGIPAMSPNPTGSMSVTEVFADRGIKTPLINLPGCPPHPDWFVGTVASVLIGGLKAVEMDNMGRPLAFYGKLIHDNCQRRGHFDAGKFAKKFSEPYCLFELGCKGPITYADCPTRMWNSGTNWCVGSSSPCVGCANPDFPEKLTPIRKVAPIYGPTPPTWLPPMEEKSRGISPGAAAGLGVIGGLAVGAAATAIAKGGTKKPEKTEE